MTCPLGWHTKSVFTALKIVGTSPIWPRPQSLGITDLFTVAMVLLPFPECHQAGIARCAAASDRLLPLSHVRLRFSWLPSSLLFNAEEMITKQIQGRTK